ncbi:hexokinase-4-like [Oncorhynchus clarkii lewisi]|uniref:hexokinase-4-like n=1 Tax=Oncorhynchus clarkii lewisi TaxID=490388 RepID=UPI0039B8CBD9
MTGQRHQKAPLKMLPTFVRTTPNGTETGDFLAPDLGGTNLRVLYLKLEWRISSMKDVYTIHEKVDTSGKWFYHIAACLAEFLELKDQTLPLGCTFSFEQKDIDKSILIRWTKGFL